MLTTVTEATMPDFIIEKRRFRMKKVVTAVFEGLSVINAAAYTLLVIYEIESLTASVLQLVITCLLLALPFVFLQVVMVVSKRLAFVLLSRKIRSPLYK